MRHDARDSGERVLPASEAEKHPRKGMGQGPFSGSYWVSTRSCNIPVFFVDWLLVFRAWHGPPSSDGDWEGWGGVEGFNMKGMY